MVFNLKYSLMVFNLKYSLFCDIFCTFTFKSRYQRYGIFKG